MTRLTLSLVILASATLAAQGPSFSRFRIDAARYQAHLKILASDDFGGRGNGTAGLLGAADYIADQFSRASLEGGGDTRGYLQPFDIESPLKDGAGTLLVQTADGEFAFRIGQHYYPLSAPRQQIPAASPPASGLVFAGYGIVAPGFGYDDYAGLDVAGQSVIVFTHEPQEADEGSVFEGRALTPHSDIQIKASLAAARGARLLIVVEDPSHVTDRALTRDWERDPQIDRYDLPVVRLERSRLDRSLTAIDFESTARLIDRTGRPASQLLSNVTVTPIDPMTRLTPRVNNVVGVWRGNDAAAAREAIVIGAHYDHLGHGGRFSGSPRDVGEVHNGADDNASGTAALIAIAEVLSRGRTHFRRPIVLAAFAGEEIGLLGSQQFVRRLPAGVHSVVAMINLDMIGRARGRVMVNGADRAPFRALVRELRPLSRLRLADFSDGYADGASDNASFERADVPTLAFFTGFHDDYHRPSDDWDRIDTQGASQIAQLAAAIAARLADR
jgi:hypothetical protein